MLVVGRSPSPSRFSSEHANMVGLVLGLDFMETPWEVRIILSIKR